MTSIVSWCVAQWDRALAGLLAFLGAVALIVGWAGAASTGYVSRQVPYLISGGIGGIFLLAAGATLVLSADIRDEWRELRAMRLRLDELDSESSAVGS